MIDNELLMRDRLRRQPRSLDKEPDIIKLNSPKEITVCGFEQSFISMYNSFIGTVDEPLCTVDVMGKKQVTCDETVFYILKALLLSNVSKSVDFSIACTDTFTQIIRCSEEHLTAGNLYDIITAKKPASYEEGVLQGAILRIIDDSRMAVREWLKVVNQTNLYPALRDDGIAYLCENNMLDDPDTLVKLLRKKYLEYNKREEDKLKQDFADKIIKGLSKEFIGALYLVYGECPTKIVVDDNAGFMGGS